MKKRQFARFSSQTTPLAGAFCLATLAGTTFAVADAAPEPPDFRATVTGVDENGNLEFNGQTARRIWGVVANREYLLETLIGVELICYGAGFTGTSIPGIEAVDCFHLPPDPTLSWRLSEKIIQDGQGVEICGETMNAFETCR